MRIKASFATVFVAILAMAGSIESVFAGGNTFSECVAPCTPFTDADTGAQVCSCPSTLDKAHRPPCPVPPCVAYTDPVTGQFVCACPRP
jgi:hypothetical protein